MTASAAVTTTAPNLGPAAIVIAQRSWSGGWKSREFRSSKNSASHRIAKSTSNFRSRLKPKLIFQNFLHLSDFLLDLSAYLLILAFSR